MATCEECGLSPITLTLLPGLTIRVITRQPLSGTSGLSCGTITVIRLSRSLASATATLALVTSASLRADFTAAAKLYGGDPMNSSFDRNFLQTEATCIMYVKTEELVDSVIRTVLHNRSELKYLRSERLNRFFTR